MYIVHQVDHFQNDWYEYVEYGTCNEQVIGLQKHGFLREQALLLTKNPYSAFVLPTIVDIFLLNSTNTIS